MLGGFFVIKNLQLTTKNFVKFSIFVIFVCILSVLENLTVTTIFESLVFMYAFLNKNNELY